MKRDKAPSPIIRKTPQGLTPASGFDAERVFGDAIGTEYDLVKRSKRSNPQNGLYWKMLARVVAATGRWPTDEHLHAELKLACGYRMTVLDWQTGEINEVPDSTAFDAMKADEFKVYFDHAVAKLADFLGEDPLAFYEAA